MKIPDPPDNNLRPSGAPFWVILVTMIGLYLLGVVNRQEDVLFIEEGKFEFNRPDTNPVMEVFLGNIMPKELDFVKIISAFGGKSRREGESCRSSLTLVG